MFVSFALLVSSTVFTAAAFQAQGHAQEVLASVAILRHSDPLLLKHQQGQLCHLEQSSGRRDSHWFLKCKSQSYLLSSLNLAAAETADDERLSAVIYTNQATRSKSYSHPSTGTLDNEDNNNNNDDDDDEEADLLQHKKSRPLSSTLDWIRHHLGTKSPYPHEEKSTGRLKDVPEGYELAQLHLSSESLYPAEKAGLLAAKGESDLYQIGRRFGIRYKEFLDRYPYHANTYGFRSSAKSRCSQSSYSFSLGLLRGRQNRDPGSTGDIPKDERPPVQPVDITTLPVGLDKEMAVKYACPRWLENVNGQPSIEREQKLFQESFIPQLAEKLSQLVKVDKTGAQSVQANITAKDVANIYQLCGFEVSMYEDDQTWCKFFMLQDTDGHMNPEDLVLGHHDHHKGKNKVGKSWKLGKEAQKTFLNLEIGDDLGDYYSLGPGTPFNRHLGCKLGTDLVEQIDKVLALDDDSTDSSKAPDQKKKGSGGDEDEDGPGIYRGLFKFGHSETIYFFSSFMNLYSQSGIPLTGNMTSKEYADREFKSSQISPFASNMAFEVYRPKPSLPIRRRALRTHRTKSSKEFSTTTQSKEPQIQPRDDSNGDGDGIRTGEPGRGLVRLLVNEKPMIIPGCPKNSYFCEWSTLRKVMVQAGAGCDFEKCCKGLGGGVGKSPKSLLADYFGIPVEAVVGMGLSRRKEEDCLPVEPLN
ncbi:PHOsphatase [Lunasporangiospora selenospora]|uniref:Multiple inositol polyphosphate phosphatase 1 n=1 Tax=Lunasporangiospora selenospora TaxID=979761 RepID=A0A9P6KF17_9FUNG|nr:PHOsphatase [Lunasporangiospora selenospora]